MVVHNVICDECGKGCDFPSMTIELRGRNRTKLHQIRAFLKMCGWRVSLPGGKDYCLECWRSKKK